LRRRGESAKNAGERMPIDDFIRGIPKAELHLHLEGTLEPELMFQLAARNRIALPYRDPDALRAAYDFNNLQEFLDLYYVGTRTLLQAADFYDLAMAYFHKCRAQNIRRIEAFFDPQAHTERGVPIATVFDGLLAARRDAERDLALSVGYIICCLRHLGAAAGLRMLNDAAPYLDQVIGIGLDSTEIGNPPADYAELYEAARRHGLRAVAHAGEEGPAAYIWDALTLLRVERIDHGVRATDDPALVAHLAERQIPLTICPISNLKLKVFSRMEDHSIAALYRAGILVTINSDDPAYFGGSLVDNYRACATAFGFTRDDIRQIAGNGFTASFLTAAEKQRFLATVADFARENP
jgi:adenine deaminase